MCSHCLACGGTVLLDLQRYFMLQHLTSQNKSSSNIRRLKCTLSPFITVIVRVLDHWTSPVPVLMGTSPPFNELPSSLLSTGCSGVNSGGERSQDHRLHNAADCWLLMLRLVLRGEVGLCVCISLIMKVFFCLCLPAYVSTCVGVSFCDVFAKERHAKRRDLIGQTTLADETWWTPGFLSSRWWGFGGLSLRGGEIQFPPLACLLCLDRLAWDRRGCVTLHIIHIHGELATRVESINLLLLLI